MLGRTGARCPNWKGAQQLDRDGYIRTHRADHPWPRKNGYVAEHVRVYELHMGRRITADEVVHHRDHNRQNNSLDNLQLMTRSAHSSLHGQEVSRSGVAKTWRRARKVPKEEWSAILAATTAGENQATIGARYGIGRSSVGRICAKAREAAAQAH
jgi:hypothetical protein